MILLVQACSANLSSVPQVQPVDATRAQEAYERGNERLRAREYQAAITEYSEAISRDPNRVEAYNNRAVAYCLTDRGDHAVSDLERAVATATQPPDRLLFLYNLGTTHLIRGYYPQAAQALERVVELDRRDRDARINLAVAYTRIGELQQAEDLLVGVLQEDPDHLQALANLGIVQEEQGEVERAMTTYQRTLDVAPLHWQTLRNLGMLEVDQGMRARAIRHLEAFLEAAPPWVSRERYRSILRELRR
ncbi:MAG: tetratricopeptide repeat protein [Bradymonadales bacterium]|nr:tetratricopeptide repeat protein [Bradymonadales bacterium]